MRLTWKREAREKGLAGVCQGERGFDLRASGPGHAPEYVGSVRVLYKPWTKEVLGYIWNTRFMAALGVPLCCSPAKAPYATIEEAKAACLEYVKGCLKDGAK